MVSCLGLLVWQIVAHFWSGTDTSAFKWYQQCRMKGAQGQIPRPSVPCLTHLFVSKLTNWTSSGQTPGTGWQQSSVEKKHTAFIYFLACFYLALYPHLPKVSTRFDVMQSLLKLSVLLPCRSKAKKGWLMYRLVAAIINKGTFSKWLTKKLTFSCSSIFSGLPEHVGCWRR